eukprot:TRINITY_DN7879_c0_g1_i1.p1 TRINITY_DN7879_c0_g1~~TRINITY_DN7879_c0_g1_i1.p1  ORF type:complete len:504 (-),score=116.30 TRINITY_DN7879_c0_g1_i1:236-1747(-)
MKYKSTRDSSKLFTFREAVFKGLAEDGGLFVPDSIPQLNLDTLWKGKNHNHTFQEIFLKIVRLFVSEDEIPEEDLKKLVEESYTSFRSQNVVEIKQVGKFRIMELFHGPTYSFKDVALQFLGRLFEYFLNKNDEHGPKKLTILGATSGDTGSAAIHGLRNRKNIEVFILFPHGRVSPVQQLQMTSVKDPNIHCISLKGTFDDCQNIVKKSFGDSEFASSTSLGAINSINLARIVAQITYYFYTYIKLMEDGSLPDGFKESIIFSVPTGNFGDILSGFYAKLMGLPIDKLFLGTNENDVLHTFFNGVDGLYKRSDVTHTTWSPSMDITVASNFERFLFFLSNNDDTKTRQWMQDFNANHQIKLGEDIQEKANKYILSNSVNNTTTLETIKKYYFTEKPYLLCPHTAVGVAAAENILNKHYQNQQQSDRSLVVVCLATAHPGKFVEAIEEAIGKSDEHQYLPEEFKLLLKDNHNTNISDNNHNFKLMENDVISVKQYIQQILNQQ